MSEKVTWKYPDGEKADSDFVVVRIAGKCANCGHEIETQARIGQMEVSLDGVEVKDEKMPFDPGYQPLDSEGLS